MTSKKNNFLPLLLIGGGAAAAALLYGFGTKKNEEEFAVVDGFGTVGSGDFLASSGVSKGYDSVDLGIEDFANNRAMADAFSLPSDGANPEHVYDDSGEWGFADTLLMGASVATVAAPIAYARMKSAGTKAASSTATQAVKSTAAKAASTASGSAAKSLATSLLKKAGPVGAVATGIDALVGTANAAEAQFNEQEIYQIANNVSTDLAAKVGIGNMVTDRQLKHVNKLSAGVYPVSMASKEETALVNQAVGRTSGDVIKVSGVKWTSYVPESGMQVVHSNTGTLQHAVDIINEHKARKAK